MTNSLYLIRSVTVIFIFFITVFFLEDKYGVESKSHIVFSNPFLYLISAHLFFLFFASFFKKKVNTKIDKSLLFLFLLYFLHLLVTLVNDYLYSLDTTYIQFNSIKYAFLFFLLFSLFSNTFSKNNLAYYYSILYFFVLIKCNLIILFFLFSNNYMFFEGTFVYLAVMMCLTSVFFIKLRFYRILFDLIIFIAIILTTKKIAIVGLFLYFVMNMFIMRNSKYLFFPLFILVISNINFQRIIDFFYFRDVSTIHHLNDITSHLSLVVNNLFTGIGGLKVLNEIYDIEFIHNIFIKLTLNSGLIGLLFTSYFLYFFVRKASKLNLKFFSNPFNYLIPMIFLNLFFGGLFLMNFKSVFLYSFFINILIVLTSTSKKNSSI